jgi:hypothetical protein
MLARIGAWIEQRDRDLVCAEMADATDRAIHCLRPDRPEPVAISEAIAENQRALYLSMQNASPVVFDADRVRQMTNGIPNEVIMSHCSYLGAGILTLYDLRQRYAAQYPPERHPDDKQHDQD